MGRSSLRIIMVLGVLVTLVGGTGIFAVFTDQATTGDNSVESGPRASAAHLQIAEGSRTVSGDPVTCPPTGLFLDDLGTGVFSVTGVQPGDAPTNAFICLYNAGSSELSIVASVIDLNDEDVDCTGDEAAAGDLTCGGFQAGELGSVLALQINAVDCALGISLPIQSNSVVNWVSTPVSVPSTILPGNVMCLHFEAFYPGTIAEADVQLAQSDRVQWRLAFDGTAIE